MFCCWQRDKPFITTEHDIAFHDVNYTHSNIISQASGILVHYCEIKVNNYSICSITHVLANVVFVKLKIFLFIDSNLSGEHLLISETPLAALFMNADHTHRRGKLFLCQIQPCYFLNLGIIINILRI